MRVSTSLRKTWSANLGSLGPPPRLRVCFALLLLLLAPCIWALDPPAKPEGYVSDFARVVDGATRAQLERYAGNVERLTGAQLAFVTIDSLENEPIEEFANKLYRSWGIGKKGQDEGLLLLLVVRDRRSRIEVGRGLEPVITDGTSGETLRAMRPALRANDYGDAMLVAARSLGDKIAKEKNVSLDQLPEQPRPRTQPEPQGLPWPLIVFGIIFLFFILGNGRRGGGGYGGGGGMGNLITGMILGNMMGRGRGGFGGSSGGGFGGYDSGGGGGFGGFGGGDSGGGGASSDW